MRCWINLLAWRESLAGPRVPSPSRGSLQVFSGLVTMTVTVTHFDMELLGVSSLPRVVPSLGPC